MSWFSIIFIFPTKAFSRETFQYWSSSKTSYRNGCRVFLDPVPGKVKWKWLGAVIPNTLTVGTHGFLSISLAHYVCYVESTNLGAKNTTQSNIIIKDKNNHIRMLLLIKRKFHIMFATWINFFVLLRIKYMKDFKVGKLFPSSLSCHRWPNF